MFFKKQKKFCCESFKIRHETSKDYGLNIRIIKLKEEHTYSSKELRFPYRFIVTEGYTGKSNIPVQNFIINYCPFCGTELRKKYRSDEYINEENPLFWKDGK